MADAPEKNNANKAEHEEEVLRRPTRHMISTRVTIPET